MWVFSGRRVDGNSCINCLMGFRRKIVDRYYFVEWRSELNERLDVEKVWDRAIVMVNLDYLSRCLGFGKDLKVIII